MNGPPVRVAVALSIVVLGCNRPDTPAPNEHQELPSSPSEPQPKTESPTGEVVVVESGAEPRTRLAYVPQVGDEVLVHRTHVVTTGDENAPQVSHDFTYQARTVRVSENDTDVEFTLHIDRELKPVAIAAPAAPQTTEVTLSATFRPDGMVVKWGLDLASERLASRPELQQLATSLLSGSWLPESPVGVGATWRIDSPSGAESSVRIDRSVQLTLVSRVATRIELSRQVRAVADKQAVTGGRVLLEQSSSGTATISIDLAAPVPFVPRHYKGNVSTQQTVQRPSGAIARLKAQTKTIESTQRESRATDR